MSQHLFRPLALATALVIGGFAMNAPAQTPTAVADQQQGTLLSVTASAEASRAPDIASISAGVVNRGSDANAALRANAEQMTQVMRAVRAAGIAERDVQTGSISLYPDYRHVEGKSPEIIGYNARNSVNLTVRDVAKLGQVLDALAASGANEINGPSFEIDQPDAVYDEARVAAIGKARERAELYARTLGLQVRRVVSISEGGGFDPRPPMMRSMAMDRFASTSSPVAPGESTLSVSLEVVFELGR